MAFAAGLLAMLIGGMLILGAAGDPRTATVASSHEALAITPDPPGAIDGAKNPELIPDEVALRLIVQAVAEPASASEEQKARAQAKINPMAFSDDDAGAFVGLLTEFRTQADALDKKTAELRIRAPFPHPASVEYRQLVELGRQRNQLLSNTVAALPASLSEDGLAKLGVHLQQAKKGMKIIPDPTMSK